MPGILGMPGCGPHFLIDSHCPYQQRSIHISQQGYCLDRRLQGITIAMIVIALVTRIRDDSRTRLEQPLSNFNGVGWELELISCNWSYALTSTLCRVRGFGGHVTTVYKSGGAQPPHPLDPRSAQPPSTPGTDQPGPASVRSPNQPLPLLRARSTSQDSVVW